MPMLRSSWKHRRDPRARAPQKRKRRNLVKFIPEADSDFAYIAQYFLWRLKSYPKEHGVSQEDVARIATAVGEFRSALAMVCDRLTRNPQLVSRKDAAREEAEKIVRRYANIIRANPDVSDTNKKVLRLKLRPKKLGKRKCPRQAPKLRFLGSGDGVAGDIGQGSGSGVHVLQYSDQDDDTEIVPSNTHGMNRRAKPRGATRIELFFDMIPAGEPVPHHPAERGWPKYLRSFTRSPIEVEFPIPANGPMLIVYWAKWADSTGETSRWSRTCVARVEGWTDKIANPHVALTPAEGSKAEARSDARYFIAERQVHERYMEQIEGHGPRQLESAELSKRVDDDRRLLDAA